MNVAANFGFWLPPRLWRLVIPVIGQGQIAVWEGASLWLLEDGQASAAIETHAHHAIQITFQLKGESRIGVDGVIHSGPVTIVQSDVPHTFEAKGTVAFLFIAPESGVGRAIQQGWGTVGAVSQLDGGVWMEAFKALRQWLEADSSPHDLAALGRMIVSTLPVADGRELPDSRVVRMIGFARRNLADTISLRKAADHVHLSQGRARHLFAAHTGLPFKSYILWLRLERAVSLYARGHSLTEAAYQAGFSDSAHLSRTFRRTFGLPAAALRLYQSQFPSPQR